jgi:hypothetical protein
LFSSSHPCDAEDAEGWLIIGAKASMAALLQLAVVQGGLAGVEAPAKPGDKPGDKSRRKAG